MSEQPPSPYGPAYGGPPGVPPGAPPPGGMSNKAKFWIGAVLALPAMVASAVLMGLGASVPGPNGDSSLGAVLSMIIGVILLVGYVTLIVLPRTRWLALGMLAGGAVVLILAAGACIALLVALSNSYG